jgi:hypothetical protein
VSVCARCDAGPGKRTTPHAHQYRTPSANETHKHTHTRSHTHLSRSDVPLSSQKVYIYVCVCVSPTPPYLVCFSRGCSHPTELRHALLQGLHLLAALPLFHYMNHNTRTYMSMPMTRRENTLERAYCAFKHTTTHTYIYADIGQTIYVVYLSHTHSHTPAARHANASSVARQR